MMIKSALFLFAVFALTIFLVLGMNTIYSIYGGNIELFSFLMALWVLVCSVCYANVAIEEIFSRKE